MLLSQEGKKGLPKALSKMETSLNGKGDAMNVDVVEMNKQLPQQVTNLELPVRRRQDVDGQPVVPPSADHVLRRNPAHVLGIPSRGKGEVQRKGSRARIFQS